ncbi:MAG: T9SS type A sorting domain-containing protein [Crocinitomicaceae bacterium]|nr:T9SS type A sorting domain-containing protein [Crocinitomicaceae bacterium]
MNKLYILFICLFAYTQSFTQSNGCGSTPQNLSVNSACIVEGFTNNENGTSQTVNASCAAGYGTAYEDVWYSVTGTGNTVTITLDASNQDAVLAAFTSCGAGEIVCLQIDAGFTGSISFGTTLATTYFIQIQRRSGGTNSDMSGNICASDPLLSGSGAPANDEPCSATTLTVGSACTFTTGTNVNATTSAGVPAPGCASHTGGDVWYEFTVPASGNVEMQIGATLGGISDGGMAVYSGTCSSLTLIECNDDDGAGLLPLISLTGQTPGATLFIMFWAFGNSEIGIFDICVSEPAGPPLNIACDVPDPICSGTPITFTAQSNGTTASTVNPGNNYDCLSTTPNPSWYYLEIDTGGDIAIDITAGQDIDFALWGPYANIPAAVAACNAYPTPIDCSYSTASTEQANVTGVVPGEVYVLLVTNYAAVTQTISLNEAGSNTATTDCSILSVTFGTLEGKRTSENVLVEWSTVTEDNNNYFVVERSYDGGTWSAIDVVNGAGNSTNELFYSSIDRNAQNGIVYYRIKQFDFDGSIKTSDIITVTDPLNADIHLFPNPAKEKMHISVSDFFTDVQITDIRGNIVLENNYSWIKQTTLDVSTLSNGLYYVNIIMDSGVQTERVVIQR